MNRVSLAQLVALADGMPLREREIVETVGRLSLVSGRQLAQLFFSMDFPSSLSRARLARRILSRLVEQRALARLERRRGGAGGGSSSWVYALGPVGRRLIAYWAGEGLPRSRGAYEPSAAWTAHTLAVADVFVRLRLAERAGRIELLAFDGEPACWRAFPRLGGAVGVLKPDAYVRLGVAEFEDVFFLEQDMGSEHRGQLSRQHQAYIEHFQSGVEQAESGIYPGVLWLVPNERRLALLADIQRRLPERTRRLFTTITNEQVCDVLCGDATTGGIA